MTPAKLSVHGRLEILPRIRRWARALLSDWGVSGEIESDLVLALTEICTNVIRHGYRGRPGEIRISGSRRGRDLRLIVEDEAPPFVPRPTRGRLPEELAEGGYGLSLIHATADEVKHEPLEHGNRTILVKRGRPDRQASTSCRIPKSATGVHPGRFKRS
jgi:anti-sigma regulatory factor (Ser/Thr protein kinase)